MSISIKDMKALLNDVRGVKEPARPGSAANPIDVSLTGPNQGQTTLFSFLSIETGSECNRSCSFCPVSHYPREHDEWMPQSMFDKIIAELVELKYKDRVALYSYNEPVRDPRLPDLIAQVRRELPRTCIMINSNGDYFKTSDDIQRLYDAGLNQMQINVYSAADGSGNPERIARGIEKAKQRYEFLKGLVDALPHLDQEISLYQHIGASKTACQVVPKWNFQPVDSHDNNMPTKEHGISVRHHIANRAGNIPNFMPALTEPQKKMCIRPFRAMTLNWQGQVILCCNDFHAAASTGNVANRTLLELWNDPRFHAYRVKLQAKDRNIAICDVCDYNGGFYQHNVPHVTLGAEEDARVISADMRTLEAAGFEEVAKPALVQLKRRRPTPEEQGIA